MASDTKDTQAAQFDISESTGTPAQENGMTQESGSGMAQGSYSRSDPRYHTANIKRMLQDLRDHAREDVSKVSEPKARVLFETTAEVLQGLLNAYDHYERKSEPSMR